MQKNMHIMSTNFAKRLVWKHEYDVKLWRHKQHTANTNDHHMPLNENPHHEKFLRTPLDDQLFEICEHQRNCIKHLSVASQCCL